MPTLEKLEAFKKVIDNLGDESRILRERGESIQDVRPPEPAVDLDLDLLLADDLSEVDEDSQGGVDEMEALLGGFSDDMADSASETDDSEIDPVPDDFVLDDSEEDVFGDLDAPEGDDFFDIDSLDLGVTPDDAIPPDGQVAGGEAMLSGLDDESPDQAASGGPVPGEYDFDEAAFDEFSDTATDADVEASDNGAADTGAADATNLPGDDDFNDLDGLLDMDDLPDSAELPDVNQALDGLEQTDALDDLPGDELTLDDELNFDDELGADLISDLRDIDDDDQQFSMDDFGEQYNFSEADADLSSHLGVDLGDLETSLDDAVAEGEAKPFAISEDDYTEIRRTLAALPRNLKLAIEEILADERKNGEDIRPLVDSLIAGDSPKALVVKVKAITRRKIVLPRGYEKQSGLLLSRRREALGSRLLREGWPVVRVILLVISVSWITAAAIFMWVYRPIKAAMLYEAGLTAVSIDEVDDAARYFFDAWDGWPLFLKADSESHRIEDAPVIVKGWKQKSRWLEYARALRRRKHWSNAEDFYQGYLAAKPESKDVRLEYASFLSEVLGQYEKAIDTLENGRRISGNDNDRDYLLSEGDVFLDWAEDDAEMFGMARQRYAKVLEVSRNDERAFLSMMRYQLRLDNQGEIIKLLPVFDKEKPGETDAPSLAAEVYAGLAEFHLERGSESETRRFLSLALSADPSAPEPTFVNALFWKTKGDEEKGLNSYQRTLVNLEGKESLSRKDLEMRILSLGGMGRINLQRSNRLRSISPEASVESKNLALKNYLKALDLYEDARKRNQLGASSQYGVIYTELGDLFFEGSRPRRDLVFTLLPLTENMIDGTERTNELQLSIDYYNEGEALFDRGGSGSSLPVEALYRRAYSNYVLGRRSALVDFHRVVRRRPDDFEARISLATSLLHSGDYEASRSQYARTITLLDEELRKTGGELMPFKRPGHTDLLLRYVVSWNNLGVGRARSAARGGGEDDYAAALGAFTMASEYLDMVYSDMDQLIREGGVVALRDADDRRVWDDTAAGERNNRKEIATNPYQNRLRLLGLSSADIGATDVGTDYLIYTDIPSSLR